MMFPMMYPMMVLTNRLMLCGCGEKLYLLQSSNKAWEFHYDGSPPTYVPPADGIVKYNYYVECVNPKCMMAIGKRFDPYVPSCCGAFEDEDSAIEAANRAVSGCNRDIARIDNPPGFDSNREEISS